MVDVHGNAVSFDHPHWYGLIGQVSFVEVKHQVLTLIFNLFHFWFPLKVPVYSRLSSTVYLILLLAQGVSRLPLRLILVSVDKPLLMSFQAEVWPHPTGVQTNWVLLVLGATAGEHNVP